MRDKWLKIGIPRIISKIKTVESFATGFLQLLKFTIRAESEGNATVAALINFGSSSLSWLRCLTLVFFIVSGLSSKLKAPSMRPPAA